jgi:hypothetical protein
MPVGWGGALLALLRPGPAIHGCLDCECLEYMPDKLARLIDFALHLAHYSLDRGYGEIGLWLGPSRFLDSDCAQQLPFTIWYEDCFRTSTIAIRKKLRTFFFLRSFYYYGKKV